MISKKYLTTDMSDKEFDDYVDMETDQEIEKFDQDMRELIRSENTATIKQYELDKRLTGIACIIVGLITGVMLPDVAIIAFFPLLGAFTLTGFALRRMKNERTKQR